MPHTQKWLLKFLYIDNAPVPFICRRLKIKMNPRTVFELERMKAETMLEQRLVNSTKSAYSRDYNSIPV